jgi:hypothetical protein
MSDSLVIPRRFNGPQENGNGGYAAGAVAAFVDGAIAEVSLRSPVPLETALAVTEGGDGSVRALDGDTLIAEARPLAGLDLVPPEPVGVEAARDAAGRYRGLPDGPFSHCFVCGRAREDSLRVFAGKVEGRNLVASPWIPPAWAAGADGLVRPEIVWAVLDCPTFFAAYMHDELPISFLVRQAAQIDVPVKAGEEHVVVAWPLADEGHKRQAASAVFSAEGEPLAIARVLLVEPQSDRQ